MPLCSVIVCARNDESRIRDTLRSIVNQSCVDDVEVVVVEGMSDDATYAVAARELAGLRHVVIDSAVAEGIYPAMNRGLRLATGQYVYFLNCGDQLRTPDVLGSVLGRLATCADPPLVVARVRHHAGGVGTPFTTATIPFRIWSLILGRQDYNHQAMLFNRSAALAAGGFDPRYGVVSDYHLILRLSLLAPPLEVEQVIADYEGGGVSTDRPHEIPRLQAWVRRDIFSLGVALGWLNQLYGEAVAWRRWRLSGRRDRQVHRAPAQRQREQP